MSGPRGESGASRGCPEPGCDRHSRSHEACPVMLQLTHRNLSWSVSAHSAVLCSPAHVPHVSLCVHLAAKWLVFRHWHFRHLLGSLRIRLAHTLLPAITIPSRMI